MLLVDEHDARVAARALGLKAIGLLAVLLFAKRTGRLDSVEETMRTLQKGAGFYIASDLFELLLREAGER